MEWIFYTKIINTQFVIAASSLFNESAMAYGKHAVFLELMSNLFLARTYTGPVRNLQRATFQHSVSQKEILAE